MPNRRWTIDDAAGNCISSSIFVYVPSSHPPIHTVDVRSIPKQLLWKSNSFEFLENSRKLNWHTPSTSSLVHRHCTRDISHLKKHRTKTSWGGGRLTNNSAIPLCIVFALKTGALKRMSTTGAWTLFVTRLTREPSRTMLQPFMPIRLTVKGFIHLPAGRVEHNLKHSVQSQTVLYAIWNQNGNSLCMECGQALLVL